MLRDIYVVGNDRERERLYFMRVTRDSKLTLLINFWSSNEDEIRG